MITQERLKELLHYDESTGVFRWASDGKSRKKGSVAGYWSGGGYYSIRIDRRSFLAHRLAWLWVNGELPAAIDHINRERDDNRISNLRVATVSENGFNREAPRTNTSGFKGVTRTARGKPWSARIMSKGKYHWLGAFDTPEQAAAAYAKAAHRLHGEFACTTKLD